MSPRPCSTDDQPSEQRTVEPPALSESCGMIECKGRWRTIGPIDVMVMCGSVRFSQYCCSCQKRSFAKSTQTKRNPPRGEHAGPRPMPCRARPVRHSWTPSPWFNAWLRPATGGLTRCSATRESDTTLVLYFMNTRSTRSCFLDPLGRHPPFFKTF